MKIPEGTLCVICDASCEYGGVIHKVNRRGARPLYVHDMCFESLLPDNRGLRRLISRDEDSCAGCEAYEFCCFACESGMTCEEVKTRYKEVNNER